MSCREKAPSCGTSPSPSAPGRRWCCRAAARRLAAGADRSAGAGAPDTRGTRSRQLREALSARAVRRTAPACRGGARLGRRPAAPPPGRAVRRARSDHARGAAARVRGARRATRQGHGLRDPRRARGTVARYPHRAHAAGPARLPRHTGRVPTVGQPGVPGVHGGGMNLWHFYSRNSEELLGLVGQHLYLVAISTGAAIVIGVPLGILLTRRPAWRGPVLGVANVFQTVPRLALFGFLIPLPFIGGIGATIAVVALVLYALLPIVRNTYEGIAGVDPAVREAGRGMGMTDWQLLAQVELPLGFGVILAGVRVATVVSVGTADRKS